MKRTPIAVKLDGYPAEFHPLLSSAPVLDSSSSPEARVIFIDRDGGYFLKSAPAGALEREALMTAYFHAKGLCRVLPQERLERLEEEIDAAFLDKEMKERLLEY